MHRYDVLTGPTEVPDGQWIVQCKAPGARCSPSIAFASDEFAPLN
jgi:hypothetical protein